MGSNYLETLKKSLRNDNPTPEEIESLLLQSQYFFQAARVKFLSEDKKMQETAQKEVAEILSWLEGRFGPIRQK